MEWSALAMRLLLTKKDEIWIQSTMRNLRGFLGTS